MITGLIIGVLQESETRGFNCQIINPWRMREGYGSRSVCLSVCLLPS